jgi:RimJ/RimL family protein N-acetyltransferase
MKLSVKVAEENDYKYIVDYFTSADHHFLNGMGVDPLKLPKRQDWLKLLSDNHTKPIEEKNIFYLIWYYNDEPIGHTNINKIVFGEEAYMHLHMWKREIRHKGIGLELMKLSIPHYFNTFKLKTLFCEPYALNQAPNKTLKKLGFTFVKEYETTPGLISFHQSVNRWSLSYEDFIIMFV